MLNVEKGDDEAGGFLLDRGWSSPYLNKWGIEHPGLKDLPRMDKESWTLRVEGEVEERSVPDYVWEGVSFREGVLRARAKLSARYVWLECLDGYATSLPIEEVMEDEVILAHRLNGEDLLSPLGGPVRLVVPKKYSCESHVAL